MPASAPDGQDSNHVHSGDPRIWGAISDLVIVKQMTIDTVPDEVMAFTPDGIKEVDTIEVPEGEPPEPPSPGRRVERTTRATLNLDKAWVTQHHRDPRRPIPFSKADEHNARTGKSDDSGMNPVNMGALGKLSDIFRISVAENYPPGSELAPPVPDGEPDFKDSSWSYNDQFGSGPSIGDTEAERDLFSRTNIIFGRLEIRIAAHFYQNDRRSGPLGFGQELWPRDEAEILDESGEGTGDFTSYYPGGTARAVELDYRFVESAFELTYTGDPALLPIADESAFDRTLVSPLGPPVIGLAGQILTGGFLFNPDLHAWGIAVSIPRKADCYVLRSDLVKATKVEISGTFLEPGPYSDDEVATTTTMDDRIFIFSGLPDDDGVPTLPKCPGPLVEGATWLCETTTATDFIDCEELGELNIQDRFLTIADRFNSVINELDRIHCIMKYLDFNIENIVDWIKKFTEETEDSTDFDAFKLKVTIIDILFAGKTCK